MSIRLGLYADPSDGDVGTPVARARLAEELGLDSVWVSQSPDHEDAGALVAQQALVTRRVGLGISILPIHTRHPVSAVQLAATLDSLSGGRFRLGLGVGHQLTVDWMLGVAGGSPLTAMREYVGILREVFASGEVFAEGEVFTARWRYSGARRPDLPILIAALGPRMLELAGEIADGVLLWFSTPDHVRDHVVPRVRAGRARAGLTLEGFEIVTPVYSAVTRRPEQPRDRMAEIIRYFARLPPYRRVMDAGGLGDDLDAGNAAGAAAGLSGIGTATDVRDAVRRFRAAGCTLPVLAPLRVPEGEAAVRSAVEAALN